MECNHDELEYDDNRLPTCMICGLSGEDLMVLVEPDYDPE